MGVIPLRKACDNSLLPKIGKVLIIRRSRESPRRLRSLAQTWR